MLIVEDDPNLALGLSDNLESEGYSTCIASSGDDAIGKALSEFPDIILLDIMLPGKSGMDVCRVLRSSGVDVPIIMLTARSQEIDKVVGLEIGADDYVTKPFSSRELLARVRAHLRRATRRGLVDVHTFSFGKLDIDFRKYRAIKNGSILDLSTREFEMLKYFIIHRDEIVTRDQLLDEVWGYKNNPISRTIDTHIAKLRQKIEDDPAVPVHIITIHGLGYRFVP